MTKLLKINSTLGTVHINLDCVRNIFTRYFRPNNKAPAQSATIYVTYNNGDETEFKTEELEVHHDIDRAAATIVPALPGYECLNYCCDGPPTTKAEVLTNLLRIPVIAWRIRADREEAICKDDCDHERPILFPNGIVVDDYCFFNDLDAWATHIVEKHKPNKVA
jgi:hypothetical protein